MTVTRRSENPASPNSSTTGRNDHDDPLFVTEHSNMDYVTLSGIYRRTGAEER